MWVIFRQVELVLFWSVEHGCACEEILDQITLRLVVIPCEHRNYRVISGEVELLCDHVRSEAGAGRQTKRRWNSFDVVCFKYTSRLFCYLFTAGAQRVIVSVHGMARRISRVSQVFVVFLLLLLFDIFNCLLVIVIENYCFQLSLSELSFKVPNTNIELLYSGLDSNCCAEYLCYERGHLWLN